MAGSPQYVCGICEEWFEGKINHIRHKFTHITACTLLYQNLRRKYLTYYRYRLQWKSYHVQSFQRQLHTCSKCNKNFISKKSVELHMITCHTPEEYPCVFCSVIFECYADLVQHTRIHADEQPYICSLCSLSFVSLTHLQKHEQTHFIGYNCQKCGVSFPDLEALNHHLISHISSFPCDVCQQKFTRKPDLIRHIRIKKPPPKCKQCRLTFKYRCELKIHKEKHIIERRKKVEERHQMILKYANIVEGDLPYACKLCGVKCSARSEQYFMRHLEHHSIYSKFKNTRSVPPKRFIFKACSKPFGKYVNTSNQEVIKTFEVSNNVTLSQHEEDECEYIDIESLDEQPLFQSTGESNTIKQISINSKLSSIPEEQATNIVLDKNHLNAIPNNVVSLSSKFPKAGRRTNSILLGNNSLEHIEQIKTHKVGTTMSILSHISTSSSSYEWVEETPSISSPKKVIKGSIVVTEEIKKKAKGTSKKRKKNPWLMPKKRRKCSNCGRLYMSLKRHLEIYHDDLDDQSSKKLKRSNISHLCSLRQHVGHDTLKPYSCKLCKMSFKSEGALRSHDKLHMSVRIGVHGNGNKINSYKTKPSNYCCKSCKSTFQTENALKSHEKLHMDVKVSMYNIRNLLQNQSVKGKEMGRLGVDSHPLQVDLINTIPVSKKVISNPEIRISCALCKRVFFHREKFQSHARTHEKLGWNMCYDCGKCYRKVKWLKSHQRKHLSKENAKLRETEDSFLQVDNINKKLVSKKVDNTFKVRIYCAICKRVFFHRKKFQSHARTHEKLGWNICYDCGKCYRKLKWLKSHQRKHLSKEDTNLRETEESFLQVDNINKKLVSKKVDNTLKVRICCTICKRVFFHREKFQSHARTHEKLGWNICYDCGKCYRKLKWLESHQRIQHSKKNTKLGESENCHPSKQPIGGPNVPTGGSDVSLIRDSNSGELHCNECKEYFFKQEDFDDHRCMLKKNARFSCRVRSSQFKTKSSLRTHNLKCWEAKRALEEIDPCVSSKRGIVSLDRDKPPMPPNGEYFSTGCTCLICDGYFHTKERYLAHMKLHQSKIFRCIDCGSLFSSRTNLFRHRRNVHGMSLDKGMIMKKELLSRKGNVQLTKVCAKDSIPNDKKKNITKEVKSKGNGSEKNKINRCPVCRRRFTCKKLFADHVALHEKSRWYICPHCCTCYWEKEGLIEHIRTGHPQINTENKTSKEVGGGKNASAELQTTHYCFICKKYFQSENLFENHVLLHGHETQYSCKDRVDKYSDKHTLVLHRRKRHPQKVVAEKDELLQSSSFECIDCGMFYETASNLHRHRETIHMKQVKNLMNKQVGQYVCIDCGNCYSLESNLSRHRRQRHSQKAFENNDRITFWRKHFKIKSNIQVKIKRMKPCDKCGDYYGITSKDCLRHLSKCCKDKEQLIDVYKVENSHTAKRKQDFSSQDIIGVQKKVRRDNHYLSRDDTGKCNTLENKHVSSLSEIKQRKFGCGICREDFKSKYLLLSHVKEKHSKTSKDSWGTGAKNTKLSSQSSSKHEFLKANLENCNTNILIKQNLDVNDYKRLKNSSLPEHTVQSISLTDEGESNSVSYSHKVVKEHLSPANLSLILKRRVNARTKFKCFLCKASFLLMTTLKYHIQRYHSGKKSEVKRSFACDSVNELEGKNMHAFRLPYKTGSEASVREISENRLTGNSKTLDDEDCHTSSTVDLKSTNLLNKDSVTVIMLANKKSHVESSYASGDDRICNDIKTANLSNEVRSVETTEKELAPSSNCPEYKNTHSQNIHTLLSPAKEWQTAKAVELNRELDMKIPELSDILKESEHIQRYHSVKKSEIKRTSACDPANELEGKNICASIIPYNTSSEDSVSELSENILIDNSKTLDDIDCQTFSKVDLMCTNLVKKDLRTIIMLANKISQVESSYASGDDRICSDIKTVNLSNEVTSVEKTVEELAASSDCSDYNTNSENMHTLVSPSKQWQTETVVELNGELGMKMPALSDTLKESEHIQRYHSIKKSEVMKTSACEPAIELEGKNINAFILPYNTGTEDSVREISENMLTDNSQTLDDVDCHISSQINLKSTNLDNKDSRTIITLANKNLHEESSYASGDDRICSDIKTANLSNEVTSIETTVEELAHSSECSEYNNSENIHTLVSSDKAWQTETAIELNKGLDMKIPELSDILKESEQRKDVSVTAKPQGCKTHTSISLVDQKVNLDDQKVNLGTETTRTSPFQSNKSGYEGIIRGSSSIRDFNFEAISIPQSSTLDHMTMSPIKTSEKTTEFDLHPQESTKKVSAFNEPRENADFDTCKGNIVTSKSPDISHTKICKTPTRLCTKSSKRPFLNRTKFS